MGSILNNPLLELFFLTTAIVFANIGGVMIFRRLKDTLNTLLKWRWMKWVALYILVVLLAENSKCSWFSNSDVDTLNKDIPRPYLSTHSAIWQPNGAKIVFCYTPLKKIDDTTYSAIVDSGGWWIIEPDGENLSYFLDPGFAPTDWHPNNKEIIGFIGWGYPSVSKVNIIDTTITDIGYFDGGAFSPCYSADGRQIMLFAAHGTREGIWVMDENGDNPRFLFSAVATIGTKKFDWSPDGKVIVYGDWSGGLSLINVDGTNERQLVKGKGIMSSPKFSPDGKKIVFDMRLEEFKDFEIFVINRDGSGLKRLAIGRYPNWSPDGRKIVFTKYSYWGKYEEGNGQLWVMDSNGGNQLQLTFIRE